MIFIVINLILSMIGNIRHGLEVTALCATFSVIAVKALTTVCIISVHDEILFWWFDYGTHFKINWLALNMFIFYTVWKYVPSFTEVEHKLKLKKAPSYPPVYTDIRAFFYININLMFTRASSPCPIHTDTMDLPSHIWKKYLTLPLPGQISWFLYRLLDMNIYLFLLSMDINRVILI